MKHLLARVRWAIVGGLRYLDRRIDLATNWIFDWIEEHDRKYQEWADNNRTTEENDHG